MNKRYRVLIGVVCVVILWKFVEYIDKQHKNKNNNDKEEEEGSKQLNLNLNSNANFEEKIKVTVYYEALCSDSRNFILKQLQPTYEDLKNNLELEFIPYGKATTNEDNGEITFLCQHGSTECTANKVHACVIDKLSSDQEKQLKYVSCMINDNMMPHYAGKNCGSELGINYEEISECANGKKGSELLKQHGIKTHSVSPEITFIPTIQINNSMNYMQSKLLKNLKKEICSILNNPPNECDQI